MVAVLFIAGDHVPVTLLLEVVGSVNVPPLHTWAIGENVGVTGGPTVTVIVVVDAHCPALGIKV